MQTLDAISTQMYTSYDITSRAFTNMLLLFHKTVSLYFLLANSSLA